MNNLYKPVPIKQIQSWAEETRNNQAGKPNTYRKIYAQFVGATANIRFDNPIQFVKGYRIESVIIETNDANPDPVIYVCSNTLSTCMTANSVILPTSITNASGADVYVDRPSTLNCVAVLGSNMQLISHAGQTLTPISYVNSLPEFTPCRGTDIITLDIALYGGADGPISTSTNTFICIGLTCEDHLRS